MSEERFVTRLSDEDIAELVLSAADAAALHRNWGLYRVRVVAQAVRMGRLIGRREALEPLDDAIRCSVDDELVALVQKHEPGRGGWISSLLRLKAFLDRYPSRGRPDDGGPGTERADG